jgi:hypothetical protein
VRGTYPPLTAIFAALRASAPPPAERVAAPAEPPTDRPDSPANRPDSPTDRPDSPTDLPGSPTDLPAAEAPAADPLPPVPAPAPPPVGEALRDAARDATGSADDIAFLLALAVEEQVAAEVAAGAAEARAAGVPTSGAVPMGRAIDAVLALLHPYAVAVAAGDPEPPAGLADRIRAVAHSAGVVEAVAGTGWSAVQRFGMPWCPRSACYGRNGSLLTDERIATEGFPPYGGGCNCVVRPADLP